MTDRPATARNARRFRLRLAGLLLAALAVYLIGNAANPLWDRDEPRYGQTSREMLWTGDWVVPRLMGTVRTAKPPGIYWLQAAAMGAFGQNAFAARLPSVLAGVGTLALLGLTLPRAIGRRRTLLAVLVLGSSLLFVACAKLSTTDVTLLLFSTAAQVGVGAFYISAKDNSRKPRAQRALFRNPGEKRSLRSRLTSDGGIVLMLWIAVGCAGLIKGPVVLGVIATTLLAVWLMDLEPRLSVGTEGTRTELHARLAWNRPAVRRGAWMLRLRPLVGLGIVALVAGPWLVMIQIRQPTFLWTAFTHDVVNRSLNPMEGHKGPPGFYLLTAVGTYAPWSLLAPAALLNAWRRRRVPWVRFAVAATVGPWVMFELVATKLPHYVLPCFVPLSVLVADALVQSAKHRIDWLSDGGFLALAGIFAAIVTLAAAGLWALPAVAGATSIPALAGIALTFAVMPTAAWAAVALFRKRRPVRAAGLLAGGTAAGAMLVYGLVLPAVAAVRLPLRLARDLSAVSGTVDMVGYKEPSLAFHASAPARPLRQREAWPPEQPARTVVIDRADWDALPAPQRASWAVVSRERGANVAKGRSVEVLIVERR